MVKMSHLVLLNFTLLMLYVLNGGFSELVAFVFYCGKAYFIHLSCMQNVCPATAQTSIKIYHGTELSIETVSQHRYSFEPQPGNVQGVDIRPW